jgi:hypothetical protein
MELRWTRNDLINTVLRDGRGKPIYRIETPNRFLKRATTISRFVPGPQTPTDNVAPAGDTEDVRTDNASDTDIHVLGLQEDQVVHIQWGTPRAQAVFSYNGWQKKVNDYMLGQGILRRQATCC